MCKVKNQYICRLILIIVIKKAHINRTNKTIPDKMIYKETRKTQFICDYVRTYSDKQVNSYKSHILVTKCYLYETYLRFLKYN